MKHLLFTLTLLILILGIPAVFFADWSSVFQDSMDAVTGASLEIPDSPSGKFYVFMNKSCRHGTLPEWQDFFTEQPVGVIFEDISCQVLAADVSGKQLADRYQARLAENQMKLHPESNSLLLSAKIENGYFDVAIVSEEIAEALNLDQVFKSDDILVIKIQDEKD